MSIYFAQSYALNVATPTLVVPAAEVERRVHISESWGNGAVSFEETGGWYKITGNPESFILPAGRDLWAIGDVNTTSELSILVTAR